MKSLLCIKLDFLYASLIVTWQTDNILRLMWEILAGFGLLALVILVFVVTQLSKGKAGENSDGVSKKEAKKKKAPTPVEVAFTPKDAVPYAEAPADRDPTPRKLRAIPEVATRVLFFFRWSQFLGSCNPTVCCGSFASKGLMIKFLLRD
jgi:hypothetical protein